MAATSVASPPWWYALSMKVLIWDRVATTMTKLRPMIVRRSSMANTSVGFDAATTGTSSRYPITSTLWCRAVASGRLVGGGEVDGLELEVDELEAHVLGHAPHEVGLGDEPAGGQDPGDGLAGAVALLDDRAHVLERDALALDEDPRQRREVGEARRRPPRRAPGGPRTARTRPPPPRPARR